MKILKSEFTISAVNEKQYPNDNLPQIVLVGKSNVGKSSFINTLTSRKKLARTSNTPGKTRLINFYKIQASKNENDFQTLQDFYFVDLPGYGFSKMSKKEQIKVGNFIEDYLRKSKNISLIIFLIDIRHNPTSDDKLMYNYIVSQNIPAIIVCSKADKIAVTKVNGQVQNLRSILNPLKDFTFLPFSAERKIYTEDVLQDIENYI